MVGKEFKKHNAKMWLDTVLTCRLILQPQNLWAMSGFSTYSSAKMEALYAVKNFQKSKGDSLHSLIMRGSVNKNY